MLGCPGVSEFWMYCSCLILVDSKLRTRKLH